MVSHQVGFEIVLSFKRHQDCKCRFKNNGNIRAYRKSIQHFQLDERALKHYTDLLYLQFIQTFLRYVIILNKTSIPQKLTD